MNAIDKQTQNIKSRYTTIRLDAGHDTNGNPRRVYLTFQSGNLIATYDEGYMGTAAITNAHHRAAYGGMSIPTTPKEYRYWATR
jgi:hypothetical protein